MTTVDRSMSDATLSHIKKAVKHDKGGSKYKLLDSTLKYTGYTRPSWSASPFHGHIHSLYIHW